MFKYKSNHYENIFGITFEGIISKTLATMLLLVIACGGAEAVDPQTPISINDTQFPVQEGHIYKLVSNRATLGTDANGGFASYLNTPAGSDTYSGEQYYFSFVYDGNDIYLYSVRNKKLLWVGETVDNSNPPHRGGYFTIGAASKVYIFRSDNTSYPYALACSNDFQSLVFNSSSDNGSVRWINDWHDSFDAGNRYKIEEVKDVATLTTDQLNDARRQLRAYSATTFDAKGISSSAVYTIKNADGYTISANSNANNNSLQGNNATTVNDYEKFAFVNDPTDDTKVYLYNISKKSFVPTSGSNLVQGSSVRPIHIFDTQDANYPVAFSFADTWISPTYTNNFGDNRGVSNVRLNNGTFSVGAYARPDNTNKFVLTPVEGQTFSASEIASAQRRLKNLPSTFPVISANRAGLSVNSKMYTIQPTTTGSAAYRGGWYANSNGLTTTYVIDNNNSRPEVDDHQRFAFVTKTDDITTDTLTYIYSISEEKYVQGNAARGSKTTSDVSNWEKLTNDSPKSVYVTLTNDYDYNLAFSFDPAATWNNGTRESNSHGSYYLGVNQGSGLFVGTYNALQDEGSRFQAADAGDFTVADLAAARSFLTGYASTTATSANITPNTRRYMLQSEDGYTLYATSSGLTINDTATVKNPNALFVFYVGNGNTYLYSVGQGRFVTSGNGYGGGTTATPIHLFDTKDTHSFTLAMGFSDTWSAGPAVTAATKGVSTTTTPDRANRFKLVEAGDMSERDQAHAAITLKGTYDPTTWSDAKITLTSQAYTIKTEAGADYGTWLKVTKDGKLVTTDTYPANDPYAQWVFYQSGGNTYLYNVGVSSFLTNTNTFGTGSNAAPVFVYNTGDTDNRSSNLAFGYATTWTGGNALNADGSTTNAPAATNRFSVAAVTSPTYKQQWAVDALAGTYTLSSLSEMGLSTDSVYYIYSGYDGSNNRYVIASGNGALDRFTKKSSDAIDGSVSAQQTHFAFLPDESDPNGVFFYSLAAKTVANINGNLVTYFSDDLSHNARHIYVYATHDPSYPLALSFSSTTWDAQGAVCINPSSGSAYPRDVTTTVIPSGVNRFNFIAVTDTSYHIATAEASLVFHRRGASNRPLTAKGMQQAPVVDYYYYVKPDQTDYADHASTINLILPFSDYSSSGYSYNTRYEPLGYIRWYNYDSDMLATSVESGHGLIQKSPFEANRLVQYYYKSAPFGLFDRSLPDNNYGPNYTRDGVVYTIPSEAENADWAGDNIACDAGMYTDYNTSNSGTSISYEPTLDVHYVFHIRSYKAIADSIYAQLVEKTGRYDDLTLADKKVLVFGAKDDNATMNIRADLQDLKYYWFYPMSSDYATKHHVYNRGDGSNYAITSAGYTKSEPVQATGIEWRVYNEARDRYRVIANSDTRSISISLNSLRGDGNDWYNLGGVKATNDHPIGENGTVYLVGLLTADNGAQKCPFFNAQLDYNNMFYPMTSDSILSRRDQERTIDYLNDRYGTTVGSMTFDDDNDQLNFDAPAANQFDQSTIPSNFVRRQYGFIYPQLAAYRRGEPTYENERNLPKHGDYGIYKQFHFNDGANITDVTHLMDPSRYGSFMAIDASDESRLIGYEDFNGRLCSGSQLIISANIANTTGNRAAEQPEVRFNIYGVEKDANGNDVRTRLLGAVCSGNFKTNALGYNDGQSLTSGNDAHPDATWTANRYKWYQVFGIFTIPANSGASSFQDFRVTIDNYCNNTQGADYAIDDIRIWSSNDKVTVIQKLPACSGDSTATFKLKVNYNTIRELTEAQVVKRGSLTGRRVYFRFFETDASYTNFTPLNPIQTRTVGTETITKDIYGNNGKDYGVATIPDAYSADDWFDEANKVHRFELNTGGTWDLLLDSIADLKLDHNKQYFVSLAFPKEDNPQKEDPDTWGRPTDICSVYSNYFTLQRQTISLSVNGTSSSNVTIECGRETTTDYNVNVDMRVPGQESGGTVTLTDVAFDWVISPKRIATLESALDHFRMAYPDAKSWTNALALVDDKYTQVDRDTLAKYVYSSSNTSGILVINGADSLKAYPMNIGQNVVWAFPTKREYEQRGITYLICDEPMQFIIRGVQNGPGLNFGIPGIAYPSSEPYRSLRLGLPQLRQMGDNDVVKLPIVGRTWQQEPAPDEDLQFVAIGSDNKYHATVEVHISATNDSTIELGDASKTKLCEIVSSDLKHDAGTVNLKKFDLSKLHEGYWYQLEFNFLRTGLAGGQTSAANCSGETFITLKIVPEYVTWDPSVVNGFNSNWNVDINWMRSTAAELLKPDYTDYHEQTYTYLIHKENGDAGIELKNPRDPKFASLKATVVQTQPKSYVPMYFSKVTIPNMESRPYPMMPFIQYNASSRLILSMPNLKGEQPTTNIQYDMMATPEGGREASEGKTSGVNFYCINFDGDSCDQIYFKTGAQLRMEQYLRYNRAWVELVLPVNAWGTFTTPMKKTFAGDMYVPKINAYQQTPLFEDMHFDDKDAELDSNGKPWVEGTSTGDKYGYFGKAGEGLYSRLRMPTYQKLWGKKGTEYLENGSDYPTHDDPSQMLIYPSRESGDKVWDSGTSVESPDFNDGQTNYDRHSAWSHTFNAVGEEIEHVTGGSNGYYQAGDGVAGKIGDDYATTGATAKDFGQTGTWAEKDGVLTTANGVTFYAANMRLPKADEEFTYYKADGNGGSTATALKQKVDRTDNYRLAVPYDFTNGSVGAVKIDSARLRLDINYNLLTKNDNDTTKSLFYVLIGNPYTSSISASQFLDYNRDAIATVSRTTTVNDVTTTSDVYRIWMLVGNTLQEYDMSSNTTYISPGQSFFVKMKRMPGIDGLTFTTNMQVDPMMQQSAQARLNSMAAAKVYRVTQESDVTNIIEHGIDSRMVCWSPMAGVVAVSGETIRRVEIYSLNGQLEARDTMTGSEKRFTTGPGMFIVKATMSDGKTETRKIAVR